MQNNKSVPHHQRARPLRDTRRAATRAPVEWSNDADWPANLATEMPVAC